MCWRPHKKCGMQRRFVVEYTGDFSLKSKKDRVKYGRRKNPEIKGKYSKDLLRK